MVQKHKPGSIVRTKNGRYAKVLANGRWRFISASAAGVKSAAKKSVAKKPTRKPGRPIKRRRRKKVTVEEEPMEEEV